MIHPLCMSCVHSCRQEDTVKIVQCPRYQKRLDDSEFLDLVDSLKDMETDAEKLRKRTQELIRLARSHADNPTEDGRSVTDDDGGSGEDDFGDEDGAAL